MALHGAEADEERGRDLGVTAAFGDHAQDVGFARSQRRVRRLPGGAARPEASHHDVRDLRIEVRAALGRDANRRDDAVRRRRLERVRIGARGERRVNLGFEILHGEDRDPRPRRRRARATCEFDPVEARQPDVDDREVEIGGGERGQRRLRARGALHVEVRGHESACERIGHEIVVLDD